MSVLLTTALATGVASPATSSAAERPAGGSLGWRFPRKGGTHLLLVVGPRGPVAIALADHSSP